MRILKNLLLSLLLVVLTSFVTYSAVLVKESFSSNASEKIASGKKQFVHAAVISGKIVPQVTLPVVTITAKRNTKNMFTGRRKQNDIVAVVNLPEVVIISAWQNKNCKGFTSCPENKNIRVVNLPEVTVVAERANANSFVWLKTNKNNIPVVDLPEVIISGDFPVKNKVTAVLYKGSYIPSINLPEVVIAADKPANLMTYNEIEMVQSGGSDSDYSVSAEPKTSLGLSGVLLIIARSIFLKF